MSKWEMVRLGDLVDKVESVNPAKIAEIIDYIDISSVDAEQKRIVGLQTIETKVAPSRARQRVSSGDILVSTVRPNLNAVAVVDCQQNETIASTGFCVLRPKPELSNRYLFAYVKSDNFVSNLVKLATGASYPAVSNKIVLSQSIPLPPIEIQQKIATILDQTTTLIEKRKTQIQKLDQLIKSRFIEMFGDPINNPMGWETVTLAECVLRIDSGRSPVCESCARKGNRPGVLKLSAVTQGTFQQGENKAVLQGAPFDPKIEVHAGDLLMTRKNTYDLVGMSAYVFSVNPYLMMSDLIFRLITTDKIDRIFLWKLLNNERFRDNVRSLAGGSAGSMPNISKQRLITLRIPLPSLPAQKEFARFTKQVDKSKFELQQGLEKLNQTYKSLMQEYFRKEPAWKQQQF